MLRNPPCTGALEQRRLCSTRGWASENNFLTLHRKFKAVYSERPHNVAFRACDDPSTAPTWGISGVHLKLRNKITMHVFIASVHVFVAWWGWGPLGHTRWGPLGRYSNGQYSNGQRQGFNAWQPTYDGTLMLSSQNSNIRNEQCMLLSSRTQWTHYYEADLWDIK